MEEENKNGDGLGKNCLTIFFAICVFFVVSTIWVGACEGINHKLDAMPWYMWIILAIGGLYIIKLLDSGKLK